MSIMIGIDHGYYAIKTAHGKAIAIKPTFPKWSQQPASSMTAVRMIDLPISATGGLCRGTMLSGRR